MDLGHQDFATVTRRDLGTLRPRLDFTGDINLGVVHEMTGELGVRHFTTTLVNRGALRINFGLRLIERLFRRRQRIPGGAKRIGE